MWLYSWEHNMQYTCFHAILVLVGCLQTIFIQFLKSSGLKDVQYLSCPKDLLTVRYWISHLTFHKLEPLRMHTFPWTLVCQPRRFLWTDVSYNLQRSTMAICTLYGHPWGQRSNQRHSAQLSQSVAAATWPRTKLDTKIHKVQILNLFCIKWKYGQRKIIQRTDTPKCEASSILSLIKQCRARPNFSCTSLRGLRLISLIYFTSHPIALPFWAQTWSDLAVPIDELREVFSFSKCF